MKPTDNIHKQIRKLQLKASADLDKRVHNEISQVLAESEKIEPARAELTAWRTIMKSRMTKWAAAAAIIIVLLGGLTFWPGGNPRTNKWWLGPSALWAQEIMTALDKVQAVTCREQTILVMADGSRHPSSSWDIFYVSRDSYRRDIYDGDLLREIQWYVPDGNDTVHHSIRFDLGSYFIQTGKGSFGNHEPIERMRFYVRLLDKANRLLGEKVIENRNCVGFEISASKYGDNPEQWVDHIWFDVETKLPVCIEKHGRPVTDQPNKTFTTIQDQFDYNPQLPADTFTPWVPEGFIHAHPDEIQQGRQKE